MPRNLVPLLSCASREKLARTQNSFNREFEKFVKILRGRALCILYQKPMFFKKENAKASETDCLLEFVCPIKRIIACFVFSCI